LAWIDFLVIGLFLLMVFSGLVRGHVRTFFEIFFLCAAFLAASLLYQPISRTALPAAFPWPDWGAAFTFVFAFFSLIVVGNILTAWIAGRKPARGSSIAVGALFGGVKGVLIAMMMVAVLLSVPLPARSPIVRDVRQSRIAKHVARWQTNFYELVYPLIPLPLPRLGTGKDVF